ncbi:MAG: glycosyltransferase family 4 protein [Kribbellaceae bacterium]|nr:glycosyltransferase family 4 protein [Kribbellaceae bacterium]
MRPAGTSGLQSHVRTFHEYLDGASRAAAVVSPFSLRSLTMKAVFGARLAIRPVSKPAGVWWYRHWHAYYLQKALDRRIADNPNVVIYTQCPVSAGAAIRARTTQPVVMAAHLNVSQADEWAGKGELPEGGRLYRSIRAYEESLLPQLDGIVYVSDFARTVLEERIPALRNVPSVVVPNPVNPSPASTAPTAPTATLASTASLTAEPADLVTVGFLESRKNHAYLIDILGAAARRGHRYTLDIIGSGPDRRALQARADGHGVGDQVRFLGYQADPPALLPGHRLYCHTAIIENLPIALLEAMAAGLPVLAGAVGGIPEMVRPGVEGQFWPLDDAETAAGVLIDTLQDEGRRTAMAAAAKLRAVTEFSREVVGRRLTDFLDTVELRQGSLQR